jgi:3-oxoacyl-[acyl-carrier-protein] synthase II
MTRTNRKRIVVTGMGVVSCFGNNVDNFYNSLLEGKSGIVPITQFPCEDFPTRFAGSINNFDPEAYLDKKQARRVDKFIAYAVAAGKESVKSANLDDAALAKLYKNRCGIIIGSGMGGMNVFYDGAINLHEKGYKRITPFFVPFIITNMGGALLGIELGFMGPNYSISTACATSNYSIISAAQHILRGDSDLMICGGVESPISPIGMAGFIACKALSQRNDDPAKASRPWDKGRDGFVMGEGAGVLVLESLEHALARNAPIYAEYLGGGLSCDAYHMTEPPPEGEGVTLCLQNTLKDAGISETQVDYVNAHGTSTPLGDMAEVRAMKKVFSNPSKITMNSTKSMIGHSLGASGGLEAIATIKAITTGMVHPTINLEDPEPDLVFDVPTQAVKRNIRTAISNSFGFGGHNASIVFGAYQA